MNVKIEIKRGKRRIEDLKDFSSMLLEIQENVSFKISARGWCYQLENMNLLTKSNFKVIQKRINECRKKGFLPIDFVASEEARSFSNLTYGEVEISPSERMIQTLEYFLDGLDSTHKFDFWKDKEYYIQILVEKIDLKTLFNPICQMFSIPIATSKGWGSILQRAELIERYKEHSDKQCVLLYCGDFDPYGRLISRKLEKNLNDLEKATNWNADNLIINRFGLNYDFIEKYNLTWIDNLESASGKIDYSNPIIKEWIEEFGERKVEGNALVVNEKAARKLCIENIFKYLKKDCLDEFQEKRDNIKTEYQKIIQNLDLDSDLEFIIRKLS